MHIKYLSFFILIIILFSCQKADLSPITGTYSGQTIIESWGFEEIKDSSGNFIGVKATRDTTISQGGRLSIIQANKKAQFTISAEGELSPVNAFSSHEFSYDEGHNFSVRQVENNTLGRILKINFDGNGNTSLEYTEDETFVTNRPPVGQKITFEGTRE